MKTYFVINSEQLDDNNVFEWATRFLTKERAERDLEQTRKWCESENNGRTYKLVEREEDIIMDDFVGYPKQVSLEYLNGTIVSVELDRDNWELNGFHANYLLSVDRRTFEQYNMLRGNDERHIVNDIVLNGFREFYPGIWRAEYNLVGGVGNSRTSHGNFFVFESKYDARNNKDIKSLKTLATYHEQMGNLAIYW